MGKMSRKEVLERFEEAVYTAKRLPPVIIPGCSHIGLQCFSSVYQKEV